MHTSMDATGRIVVPKPLREALGLAPGQPLQIRVVDAGLRVEVEPTPMQLQRRGRGRVAVPEAALPVLRADDVRDTLERTRR
jgi:AbrB family looped-hinge helix DNA binding protein